MKLAALNPRWIIANGWAGPDFYIGVSFDCPGCAPCVTCGRGAHRLAVRFHPPVDTGNLAAQYGEAWIRPFMVGHQRTSGTANADTLDALTLSPSVGLDPHWHGHITNGEMTNA